MALEQARKYVAQEGREFVVDLASAATPAMATFTSDLWPRGHRVMQLVARFPEGKLKLGVNREKSAVAPVGERKFLGHRLLLNGQLGISPPSVKRAQGKIRQFTRRNRGVSFAQAIAELNSFLAG